MQKNNAKDRESQSHRHKIMIREKCPVCSYKKIWLYNNKLIAKCPNCKSEFWVNKEKEELTIGEQILEV